MIRLTNFTDTIILGCQVKKFFLETKVKLSWFVDSR